MPSTMHSTCMYIRVCVFLHMCLCLCMFVCCVCVCFCVTSSLGHQKNEQPSSLTSMTTYARTVPLSGESLSSKNCTESLVSSNNRSTHPEYAINCFALLCVNMSLSAVDYASIALCVGDSKETCVGVRNRWCVDTLCVIAFPRKPKQVSKPCLHA